MRVVRGSNFMALRDLASEVVTCLRGVGLRVGVAESCTGGLLGGAFTMIEGASDIFVGGFISYANEAKVSMLGVSEDMLLAHGAVSEEVARAMASGVLEKLPLADIGVSITGIAGTADSVGAAEVSLDSSGKPIGLVYIGYASRSGAVRVSKHNFAGSRDAVRQQTVYEALYIVRSHILRG